LRNDKDYVTTIDNLGVIFFFFLVRKSSFPCRDNNKKNPKFQKIRDIGSILFLVHNVNVKNFFFTQYICNEIQVLNILIIDKKGMMAGVKKKI
jgi:hypothetical protein